MSEKIITKPSSKPYRKGYERIKWKKKSKKITTKEILNDLNKHHLMHQKLCIEKIKEYYKDMPPYTEEELNKKPVHWNFNHPQNKIK